jgi:hypothetical protein
LDNVFLSNHFGPSLRAVLAIKGLGHINYQLRHRITILRLALRIS